MSDRELTEFAERHGLTREARDELARLLQARVGGRDPAALPPTEDNALSRGMGRLDEGQTLLDVPTTILPTPVALPTPQSASPVPPARPDGDTTVALAGYDLLGRIGEGGMGLVYRVRDRALNRIMAIKIIRKGRMAYPTVLARFIEEAQVTAQLQHPGIVPVHHLGQLEDGRLFFTMPEVRGDTLALAIRDVHEASTGGHWMPGAKDWSLRRLVSVFAQVCETVAYAHSRDVVHRDLKPANIMVGTHGEVRVLDWGIAKILGRPDLVVDVQAPDPVVTQRTLSEDETELGSIVGTLSYMAPEQARGENDVIGPRADVYALGAVLYEILSGIAPFRGSSIAILYARSTGAKPLAEFVNEGRPPMPEGLIDICEQAMAKDPGARYADADALAHAVRDWLDGVQRREKGLALTAEASSVFADAERAHRRADALMEKGAAFLGDVPTWAVEADKSEGWRMEDKAHELRREVTATALRAKMLLRTALTYDSTLSEAHETLAERYAEEHRMAEATLDSEGAARAELSLRAQLDLLPQKNAQRATLAAYLEGDGALTVHTDPPGAQATLYRYTMRNRRLVEVFERELGPTPLDAVALPMGRYVVLLTAQGRQPVRYPVFIERQGHWDGCAPGQSRPTPVRLPPVGSLRPDEVFVPAGWYSSGGDLHAPETWTRRKVWLDDFVIQRFPVTNAQYIVFLNDLVAQGRGDTTLEFVPRERGGTVGAQGSMIYGRDDKGRYQLVPDSDGDLWDADWPVVMVSWAGVAAYAQWWSEKTGQKWAPPPELAWEKAARGVDGRHFPWGDFHDPSWSCMGQSHPGRPLLQPVESFPVDASPYGVRGMAGNVRNWCSDVFSESGPEIRDARGALRVALGTSESVRVVRGGAWGSDPRDCRAANRGFILPGDRQPGIGFRLFRVDAP